MTRRKLSRRQAWRVERIQQERRERAQRRATRAEASLEGGELGSERAGLVIAHYGVQVAVEPLDTEMPGKIQRCHLRTHIDSLVAGDRVVWRPGSETGVIVALEPRRSVLKRPNSNGELKPVAANIDQIIITLAPLPTPHGLLIDRYLIAAENTGIEPLLLLNKTDLMAANNGMEIDVLLREYERIGYRVLRASTREEQGLGELEEALADRTSVFVGQSGVGKSSLINALLPGVDCRVGELSEIAAKGRHTTTTAQLFHFPHGGNLIDSPGIREFTLLHIDEAELLHCFRELRPFIGQCRFRNCKHRSEPGCALQGAAQRGIVSARRLDSFNHIRAALDAENNHCF